MNTRVGCKTDKWSGVTDKQETGKCNSNKKLLLPLCSEFILVITNSIFKYRKSCKKTPRCTCFLSIWYLLNYITSKSKHLNKVHDK